MTSKELSELFILQHHPSLSPFMNEFSLLHGQPVSAVILLVNSFLTSRGRCRKMLMNTVSEEVLGRPH